MDKKIDAAALARRFAHHKISDEAVNSLAVELAEAKFPPLGLDICAYGKCIDYLVDRSELLGLLENLKIDRHFGNVRIFPKGIIEPDRFLVRVERLLNRG